MLLSMEAVAQTKSEAVSGLFRNGSSDASSGPSASPQLGSVLFYNLAVDGLLVVFLGRLFELGQLLIGGTTRTGDRRAELTDPATE